MSSPFNVTPFEAPQRGTGISISELGRVFGRAQYSGVGGPDVIQNGSGNFIPENATKRALAIVGEKSTASPYKFTWWRCYINENQEVTKFTPDNPDGYQVSQTFYNYLIDPTNKINTGDTVWIDFDEQNGIWIANTTGTGDFPARLTAFDSGTKRYSWSEEYFTTSGARDLLTGGRTGTHTDKPAVSLTREEPIKILPAKVWLRPIYLDSTLGQMYEIIEFEANFYICGTNNHLSQITSYNGSVVQILGHDASGCPKWYNVSTC